MRLYKTFSLAAASIFAVVGFIFLFFPDSALIFFNSISSYTGLPESPVNGFGFYLILASAYMYLVALIAYLMFRYPGQKIYPLLLANAKIASSLISIYLFLTHQHYLIYLANFVIDGFIGAAAIFFTRMIKKKEA
jgi:hypothetical protein